MWPGVFTKESSVLRDDVTNLYAFGQAAHEERGQEKDVRTISTKVDQIGSSRAHTPFESLSSLPEHPSYQIPA